MKFDIPKQALNSVKRMFWNTIYSTAICWCH